MKIPVNDIVHHKYEKVVQGEGMPMGKDANSKKGDLIVSFDVQFPSQFSDAQKAALADLLE